MAEVVNAWTVHVTRYWGIEVVVCASKREARALAKKIRTEQNRETSVRYVR